MDWALLFPEGRYVYVSERWYPLKEWPPRRLRRGRRKHFSYHFGPANPKLQANGIPERDKKNNPAIIRIDCDRWGPHMHFHGEADHIQQPRVGGMVIEDCDPFVFVRAVLEHRNTSASFDSILNFKVKP